MARRSLKPQLNQIRAWVQQGRTDAWIAHQLEVSASELREFRKQHDLTADGESSGSGEVDLRDEIEAEVAEATAEEEAAEDEEEPDEADDSDDDGDDGDEEDEADEKPARKPRKKAAGKGGKGDGGSDDGEGEGRPRRRRRRGRRGGRGRRKELEATFDHGERDGYGLWLDAGVKDNPVYKEHWAGKSAVTVRIDADQIVIRRAGDESDPADD